MRLPNQRRPIVRQLARLARLWGAKTKACRLLALHRVQNIHDEACLSGRLLLTCALT